MTKLAATLAAALLVASSPDAGAARLPDAEVFAASTTDVITDPEPAVLPCGEGSAKL